MALPGHAVVKNSSISPYLGSRLNIYGACCTEASLSPGMHPAVCELCGSGCCVSKKQEQWWAGRLLSKVPVPKPGIAKLCQVGSHYFRFFEEFSAKLASRFLSCPEKPSKQATSHCCLLHKNGSPLGETTADSDTRVYLKEWRAWDVIKKKPWFWGLLWTLVPQHHRLLLSCCYQASLISVTIISAIKQE